LPPIYVLLTIKQQFLNSIIVLEKILSRPTVRNASGGLGGAHGAWRFAHSVNREFALRITLDQ
jgi:hypothetical protein